MTKVQHGTAINTSRMARRSFLRLAGSACLGVGSRAALAFPVMQRNGLSESKPDGTQPASTALYDPPSVLAGRKLRISQLLQIAYAAGFNQEELLVPAAGVAIAESGLFTAARNWHPEKGYRAADEIITVKGPPEVWRNGRQMHSDRGVWQIASFWHAHHLDSETDDPMQCARFAFDISLGGTDFSAWGSYTGGRAQKHFDHFQDGWQAVRPVVRRFLDQQEKIYGKPPRTASN